MTYFLVKALVCRTPYMCNDIEFEDVRLVLASDLSEVKDKYMAYWDRKSDSYGDSYMVMRFEVQETIT